MNSQGEKINLTNKKFQSTTHPIKFEISFCIINLITCMNACDMQHWQNNFAHLTKIFLQEDQEVNRHLSEDDQYFAVELQRGMKGFGFSIRGGREFHSMPLFVLRMAVDGKCLTETERFTINHSINCQQLRMIQS